MDTKNMSTEEIMRQITSSDGKKVDINKLNKFTLRVKRPFRYKVLVFFEWTYGVWFVWLGISWFFLGEEATKNLFIAGIIFLFILGPICWLWDKLYSASK